MNSEGRVARFFARFKSAGAQDQAPLEQIELLHPFYLDTNMSMAFAAALAGGVSLESEEIARHTSQAVRNLRGNLRFAESVELEVGGGKTRESESTSRMVKQNTEASIFISLHQELRDSGRLADPTKELRPGDIVSMEIGPAVAPLRRLVEQIVRLLDIVGPMSAVGENTEGKGPTNASAREQGKALLGESADGENWDPQATKAMFKALLNDLDQSGMIDVVVKRENQPNVVLTLDRELVTEQTTELLHTSRFTVVGKVTQVWAGANEGVNLYRRSVMSLLPGLTQIMGTGMLAMLINMAKGLEQSDAEDTVREALGLNEQKESEVATESGLVLPGHVQPAAKEGPMLNAESAEAILPWLEPPIVQILPLAICT
jgi:hypothetical protein